jgi:hypothetical protein
VKDKDARKMIDEIAYYLGIEVKWHVSDYPYGPELPPHIELGPNNLRSKVRRIESDKIEKEHDKTGIHYCDTCGTVKGKKVNDS